MVKWLDGWMVEGLKSWMVGEMGFLELETWNLKF